MKKGSILIECLLSIMIIALMSSIILSIMKIGIYYNEVNQTEEIVWDMFEGCDIYCP